MNGLPGFSGTWGHGSYRSDSREQEMHGLDRCMGVTDMCSQGNYLIKRQHIFANVSAHAAYISVSKRSFFGRFGKSLICAYIDA